MFKVPEKYRITNGPMASDPTYGNNGMFVFQKRGVDMIYVVIASDGMGWEHVSVHLQSSTNVRKTYTPNWDDMCEIKRIFWGADDTVIQYHPPESDYVNNHPNTLHLWRPIGTDIPRPPSILVGIKNDDLVGNYIRRARP